MKEKNLINISVDKRIIQKNSLESFKDEEVTEVVKHTMDKCPKCGSMNIVEIDKKFKDAFDYLLSLEKK